MPPVPAWDAPAAPSWEEPAPPPEPSAGASFFDSPESAFAQDAPAEEPLPPSDEVPQPPAWEPEPEPEYAAEPTAPPSEPAAPDAVEDLPVAAAQAGDLTDAQIDRIARRVVELMSDQIVRNIAWEVIPDLAEMVVKERIRQLESEG
jgi:hypothetical protein